MPPDFERTREMTASRDKFLLQWLRIAILLLCVIFVSSYEWEDWDYYQILGLDYQNAKNVNSTTVKQAYRRQARAWHPDKQAQNKTVASTSSSTVTKEEATARFRRIAEAYEVLSDPEERERYDAYLSEHKQQQRPSSEDSGFSWQSFMDPWQMFENVFFGKKEEDEDDDDDMYYYDGRSSSEPSFGTQHQNQIETWYMHPAYGQVLRVTQYEYDESSDIFRLTYQDFVDDWDPYVGSWGWYPLYRQPMVLMKGKSSAALRSNNRLFPPMLLRKGPFTVGLYVNNDRTTCQIQIRRRGRVIWSAPTDDELEDYLLYRRMSVQECFLEMIGSRLVLYVNGQIMWHTPADEGQNWIGMTMQPYYASLDEDGSLTVYRSGRGLEEKTLWNDPNCCFTTGPAGCNPLGRLIFRALTLDRQVGLLFHHFRYWIQRFGKSVGRALDWAVRRIDRALDWLEGDV